MLAPWSVQFYCRQFLFTAMLLGVCILACTVCSQSWAAPTNPSPTSSANHSADPEQAKTSPDSDPADVSSMSLQQLRQAIIQLQQENAQIKRRQLALDKKLQDEQDRSSMAQELAQDLDSRNHQALKISGYADVEANLESDSRYFRLHHFSLFFHKAIAKDWRLFSEIEYEDGPLFEGANDTVTVATPGGGETTLSQIEHGSGAVFLEAMNVDYRWRGALSLRMGRFFTPAGIWSIDHYPPFVVTQERPLHIRYLFPQLVDGLDVYGRLNMGRHWFLYDLYVGNGENNNLVKGDQDGNKAIGIRSAIEMDWLTRFELGVSAYHDTRLISPCSQQLVDKSAAGAHYKLQWRGLMLQSEYAMADYETLPQQPQCRSQGAYTQAAWKTGKTIMGLRSDRFDDKLSAERHRHSLFFNYRLQKDILLKAESHRQTQGEDVTRWSIITVAVNLGD